MAKIKDMLRDDYLSKGADTSGAKIKEIKENPELSGEKPPVPIPIKKPRTLGNVFVALEAQKIYFPQLPSIANPAPAPANTFQKGVTPAMDSTGAWGQGEK